MYGTLNHETTFKWRYYRDTVAYIHMVSLNEECMLPGLHRGRRGQVVNYRKRWRHIPLLRQMGYGRTFSFFFFTFPPFFSLSFFLSSFFMTDSHTSSAKNPGASGSSRWCRACLEKTWGTCNPVGDLERVKSKTGKGVKRGPPERLMHPCPRKARVVEPLL